MKQAGILLTIAAFVFGLVLQPALGQLLDSRLSQPDAIIVATSLALICILAATVNAMLVTHHETAVGIRRLEGGLTNLEDRLGLRVEFIPRGSGSDLDPYGIVIGLVGEAEHEILVLDHRPRPAARRFGNDSDLKTESRRHYYRLFTDRVSQRQADGQYLRYRRVVQLGSGPTAEWDTSCNGDTLFGSHCAAVNRIREQDDQYPSAIKTARVFFSNASIVIVDGKTILLELAIQGPQGGEKIQGDLLFFDPDGVLAEPLRQIFENIDNQATLVTAVR
jgi:hypothetical protein